MMPHVSPASPIAFHSSATYAGRCLSCVRWCPLGRDAAMRAMRALHRRASCSASWDASTHLLSGVSAVAARGAPRCLLLQAAAAAAAGRRHPPSPRAAAVCPPHAQPCGQSLLPAAARVRWHSSVGRAEQPRALPDAPPSAPPPCSSPDSPPRPRLLSALPRGEPDGGNAGWTHREVVNLPNALSLGRAFSGPLIAAWILQARAPRHAGTPVC